MATTNQTLQELTDQMLELVQAIYAAGGRDNAARIMAAAALGTEPSGAPKARAPRKKTNGRGSGRAAWGATKQVITGAFAQYGQKGATPVMIAKWGDDHGQRVAVSSVRTALKKLRKEGGAKRRGLKWFPKNSQTGTGSSAGR